MDKSRRRILIAERKQEVSTFNRVPTCGAHFITPGGALDTKRSEPLPTEGPVGPMFPLNADDSFQPRVKLFQRHS